MSNIIISEALCLDIGVKEGARLSDLVGLGLSVLFCFVSKRERNDARSCTDIF